VTAASGTTTLTVNPFTNNTGTIDNTKNCIVSIDANTEAGGWTTSASHSIVSSGSFTSPATTSQLYKADFYNASGKSAQPYNKLTFTNWASGSSNHYSAVAGSATSALWASAPSVIMVVGCSTTSDLTGTNYVVNNHLVSASTQTSFVLNHTAGLSASRANQIPAALISNNTNCVYRMAVTANYCILWEVANGNSYSTGYSNLIGSASISTYIHPEFSYGTLFYAGFRETQPWENSLNHNPPWCGFQISHTVKTSTNTPDVVASFMATLNDTGVASSTSQIYFTCNTYSTNQNMISSFSSLGNETTNTGGQSYVAADAAVNQGLRIPILLNRDTSGTTFTNQLYMPVSDPNTGSLVPPAVPIVMRRNISGTWNNGGAARGIYKSLSMPLSTMKLYFSNGQTFTIGSDTYIPIVFNETMYLIRNA
jgi:hypothetical protein